MSKYPSIAEIYDEWLAIKSASTASTSSAPVQRHSSTTKAAKRRIEMTSSPRKTVHESRFDIADDAGPSTLMGPPPTTPSKKKRLSYLDAADVNTTSKTPTKGSKIGPAAASPLSDVHDSGGSLVDVPSTPKQDSPGSPSTFASRWTHQRQKQTRQQQKSPSKIREYESPRKIKELLSSFSSMHRTPTKEKEAEDELRQRLTKGVLPAYTPRTKARKRLRGEVVITPEKGRVDEGRVVKEQGTKKRRGMAATTTLRDYGIVSVAAPKGRANGSLNGKGNTQERVNGRSLDLREETDDEDDSEDEGDEILGPSPSVNRITDRPVKSFQPLFTASHNATSLEDDNEGLSEGQQQIAWTITKTSNKTNGTPPAAIPRQEKSGPATTPDRKADGDEEDADMVVVAYQPYGKKGIARHITEGSGALSGNDSEEDDDLATDFYGVTTALDSTTEAMEEEDIGAANTSEEDASPILIALNLDSPQQRKARRRQKMREEREIRHLLGTDDSLLHLAEEEEEVKAALPKSNKVGPPIKGGKLRKGFRDVSSSKVKQSKVAPTTIQKKPRMILQNSREQLGSDQESELGRNDSDDDEWASDVGSAEYGLGNGYMSDL